MKYDIRVIGEVNKSFILRGMLFRIGDKIDFLVSNGELDFIKVRCTIKNVIKSTTSPTPKSVETSTKKGGKNELPKSTNARNKNQNTK